MPKSSIPIRTRLRRGEGRGLEALGLLLLSRLQPPSHARRHQSDSNSPRAQACKSEPSPGGGIATERTIPYSPPCAQPRRAPMSRPWRATQSPIPSQSALSTTKKKMPRLPPYSGERMRPKKIASPLPSLATGRRSVMRLASILSRWRLYVPV